MRSKSTVSAAALMVLVGCGTGSDAVPPAPTPALEEPPAPPERCAAVRERAPPLPPPESTLGRACVDHGELERVLASELRAAYEPAGQPSRVDVTFECDALGPRADEIRFATGSGFGGTLSLFRLRRSAPDADTIEIRGLEMELPRLRAEELTYASASQHELRRIEGTLPASALDAVLPRVRTALTAAIREVALPPRPGQGRSIRSFVGATTFHAWLRVSDSEGRILERRYTGGGSGRLRTHFLGLTTAIEAIEPLLEPLERSASEPAQWERDLFTETIAIERPLIVDAPGWVAERYLTLAPRFGGADLVRDLITVLDHTADDGSQDRVGPLSIRVGSSRARVAAVNALAALTGWDPRLDEAGRPRPLDDVAADYQRECARSATTDRPP